MLTSNLVLFDNLHWKDLLPLTFTRPIADLRIGINTIREKWQRKAISVSTLTEKHLSVKYKAHLAKDNLFVNAAVLPNAELLEQLAILPVGGCLIAGSDIIAVRAEMMDSDVLNNPKSKTNYTGELTIIRNTWDIFVNNGKQIEADFAELTKGRTSEKLGSSNIAINPENIFIEKGAKIQCATLNASNGPIYIGKDAEVMEGACVRGPFALGEHSAVKMGAKIYEDTTIGPWCKIGGEVQNTVFTGFSNKGHDGYIGNSVLGEWCNLGADTNSSNLKNNYAKVKLWNYTQERFINTNLQFCGLIMGDHSKCGINTMFNTGTVVGVSANIYGAGFPRNFVPSFSWGGAAGFTTYAMKKALETVEIVMARRNLTLDGEDRKILEDVFSMTEKFR